MIPVFFLSACGGHGQDLSVDAVGTALSGCYVTRTGSAAGSGNQAGLGWADMASLSFHHVRPYLLPDLAVSTVEANLPVQGGGFGLALSVLGVPGLHLYSSWLGYGHRLGSNMTTGMGLFFRDLGSREYGHLIGAGCALGIQYRPDEQLVLGAHVRHPVSYAAGRSPVFRLPMILSAGMSYAFFQTARFYAELHAGPDNPLSLMLGTGTSIGSSLTFYLGLRTGPPSLSGGISLALASWRISMASTWHFDTGMVPACSLSYEFGGK